MEIAKIVEYINIELKRNEATSVNKIISKMGEKQSTIKTRLRKDGYSYDAETRSYTKGIPMDNPPSENKDITNVIQRYNTTPKPEVIQKYNEDIDMETLKELIGLIGPIKKVIQEYNKSITIVDVKPIELKPKAVVEVKQKLFKIDVEVSDKWDEFVKDHKEFKVQQLISLALEEFIGRYKW
ncbi:MAG: hypothetical protein RR620_12640 [Clostridium sp.]|uniref:hypothetical protein n=1 Tax=Anaerorhabdus sp. TaxID=1872524 RepID=UPI002FCB3D89